MTCSRYLKNRPIGQSLVEYALILVGIALALTLILTLTGTSLRSVYCQVLHGLGGTGCGCAFAFDSPDELAGWEGNAEGHLDIEDGKACITGDGRHTFSYLNPCASSLSTSDFVINARDITVQRVIGDKNTGFDLWFRAQDARNGYHFTYNTRRNIIRFWKRVDGHWILLAQKRVPPSWADEPLDLQIRVEGNTFTALKDGEVILQASDDAYREGMIGIRNKPSSKTCIDELTVDALP